MPDPSVSRSGATDSARYDLDAEGYDPEWACTHCNGEGLCWDGADPLDDCPDEPHPCHACYGSGEREDQWLF